MLEAKIINDKLKWNNFLLNQPTQTGIFLQSWEWLDFQKIVGHKTHRLGLIDENGELQAIAGVIENVLLLGKKYLYCPRGPITNQKLNIKNQNLLIEKIKKIAKNEKAFFIRIEPIDQNLKSAILNLEFKKTSPIQPECTLVLDLTNSEEQLLAAMHPKTRYNIRLAMRHGVTIHRTRSTNQEMLKEDFEIFWKLLLKTAKRDGFRTHPKNYYWQMLNVLAPHPKASPAPNAVLYHAKYQGKILATNLVMFFGDTATYLHGASSDEYRNVMAPHLLHWQIICEAKRLGFKYYDFWGSDEIKWPGITRFKKSFGGFEISYPGTFDLPLQKNWYKIYCLAKKIYK